MTPEQEQQLNDLIVFVNSLKMSVSIPREIDTAFMERLKVPKLLTSTVTLDFPNVNPGASTTLTVPMGGAQLSNLVVLGIPNSLVGTALFFTAYVSAQDVVTVQFDNQSAGAVNPASALFTLMVIK